MSTLNIRELLTGTARRVAHVTRFSGTPLLRPENVAEHSYMTAQYAFFIARAIQEAHGGTDIAPPCHAGPPDQRCDAQGLGGFMGHTCYVKRPGNVHIDMGLLLSRAIVHDMDETVMGDLPRPIKYADAGMLKAWNSMCLETVSRVGQQLGVGFLIEWEQAKAHGSIEGDILALADMISVTGYIVEELKLGNRFMLDICHGNIDYLYQLIERRHGHWHPLLTGFANDALLILQEHIRDYK